MKTNIRQDGAEWVVEYRFFGDEGWTTEYRGRCPVNEDARDAVADNEGEDPICF